MDKFQIEFRDESSARAYDVEAENYEEAVDQALRKYWLDAGQPLSFSVAVKPVKWPK